MLLQLLIVKSKLEKEERVFTYLYLFLHMKGTNCYLSFR